MRVVLEWSDVLEVLSQRFGRALTTDDVTVRHEPFEIEVRAEVPALSAPPRPPTGPTPRGAEQTFTYGTTVRGTTVPAASEGSSGDDNMSMDDMLRYSRELAAVDNSRRR